MTAHLCKFITFKFFNNNQTFDIQNLKEKKRKKEAKQNMSELV